MFRALANEESVRRDELGVHPFYWAEWNDSVVVSDDVNELFAQTKLPRTIRRELLGEYFAQGWICEPDTIWTGIYKVPAGCELATKDGKAVVRRWWNVDCPSSVGKTPTVRDLIRKSVDRALEGDKKVCNWFSGGIDSSVIAAFVRERGLKHLHMTLGDGESARVKAMEAAFGLDVERLQPNPDLVNLYPELCRKMGEPIADPGIIAAYWLGKESLKRGCSVVLSGMGGDELDAGYPRNKIVVKLFNNPIVRLLGQWPLKLAGWMMCRGVFVLKGKRKRDVLRLGSFLRNPDVAHYFNLFGYFTQEEIDRLVGPDWFACYREKVERLTADFVGTKKLFAYEFKGFLASHNNIYGAQACKAAGVECRTPLLDPSLAQVLWANIDLPRFVGKQRLTKVLSEEVGDAFVRVRKSGFRFPVEARLLSVDWGAVKGKLAGVVAEDGLRLLDECLACAQGGGVDEVYMKLWAFWTLAENV